MNIMADLFKRISALAVLAALVLTLVSCIENKPQGNDMPLVIINDYDTDSPLTVITEAETPMAITRRALYWWRILS